MGLAGEVGRQAGVTTAAEPQAQSPTKAHGAGVSGIVATLDRALGTIVEFLAAGLVAAEIVILFGGVISRYVFDRPLVWSDELASTLFLWLAMLGAVIAFRRDEHMRMTACVGLLPPPRRALLDAFATGAALAFLAADRSASLPIRHG